MKADKKLVAKLACGLKSQKQHEAETVARLEREHPGCGWGFVTRVEADGRQRRILVSIPGNDRSEE